MLSIPSAYRRWWCLPDAVTGGAGLGLGLGLGGGWGWGWGWGVSPLGRGVLVAVVGVVVRRFLTASHMLEASGVPGWGGGVAVGPVVVSRSRATSDRLWRPTPGRDASGGACAASGLAPRGGGHSRLRCCLWSRSGSLAASRPEGNQPGLVESSRITRCCGPVPSGWTPPGRADWLRPPTRRGIRNLPSVGSRHRPPTTSVTSAAAGAAKTRRWPPPREVGSGSLVASAQTAAHDGPTVSSPCHTKPPPTSLTGGGMDFTPADRRGTPSRNDATRDPDRNHSSTATGPVSPPPLRARPLAAQAPPEGRQRHRAPGLGAKACRL